MIAYSGDTSYGQFNIIGEDLMFKTCEVRGNILGGFVADPTDAR